MIAILGLIGKKLSHSLSQIYFRDKFRQYGFSDVDYLLFELDSIEELPGLIRQHNDTSNWLSARLVGFNVTIPYKEDVLKYLDEVDDVANEVGAVNTVLIENGKLKGFNTDVFGFEKTLLPLLEKFNHQPVKALVLGAGGSSKAVTYVLTKNNIPFTRVSRNIQQARTELGRSSHLTYEELTELVIENNLLIINTTPLGMEPNVASFPDIPYEALTSHHTLIDLVYNPLETQFLKFGSVKGAMCVNGLSMLYAQADAAWEIWKGELNIS